MYKKLASRAASNYGYFVVEGGGEKKDNRSCASGRRMHNSISFENNMILHSKYHSVKNNMSLLDHNKE